MVSEVRKTVTSSENRQTRRRCVRGDKNVDIIALPFIPVNGHDVFRLQA